MILKKPYAFFIKMFKPIHIILAVFIAYLIHLDNKILSFLTNYIYSSYDLGGENITSELVSNFLYIIPFIIIVASLLLLGIMYKKKKPTTFYVVSVFAFIIVIVINSYASNFLGMLEESVVSIKSVKLIHDLVLINIGVESVIFIPFVVRGMGINFKKFNFDSEISKFNISESDKEEFELSIKIDLNQSKTKRRRFFRNIKYFYFENKFIISLVSILLLLITSIGTYFIIESRENKNVEGVVYSMGTFDLSVDSTIILNTDYRENKITDDYLIVIDSKMKSNYSSNSLYLNDFSLKIGETIFKPTTKYSDLFVDLGTVYNEEILLNEYNNYLFIFEIPEKYITSEMMFRYNNLGNIVGINLNPKTIVSSNININKKIGEEISFEESLGDIKFKINEYDIKDKYLTEYDYCVQENECYKSKEYLKASIDENFDKYILKVNVMYEDNSDLDIKSFYQFLSKFGSIHYNIDGIWYSQVSGFEEIKSTRISQKNISYIGINSHIINASSIKLVFNVRDSKYEYTIK